ncbi:MAG: histidinol-phosphate transaminase [Burkholderiaceae bacterium]|nr:MAG: histidinol-phosphate transaminase [Burkholderiaceae bacterium]
MSRYWSPIVHGLTPYVPGEQPRIEGLVKLNTNECPYGPSAAVGQAIAAAAGAGALRLYPDPQSLALRQALAAYHGLRPEQVFVGNGSDEVLAHAFAALLHHDAPVLFPDISYSFYPVYARLFGIPVHPVALDADFCVRVDDYLEAERNGGIVIANPNAPTGIALPLAELERLLAGNRDSAVLVDEAYVDFGADSAVRLIEHNPQLLVVRTLSKSHALAGLRVGYALGHADLIEALTRVKDSFNSYPLDRLAQAGARAAIEDAAWFEDVRARIIATREGLIKRLRGLGGRVLPSQANFVFACFPGHDGAALASALRAERVLVRHFGKPQRIAPFLRVSVGTDAQTDLLLAALGRILAR